MEVSLRNEIGDKVFRKLYVELMGKYANVILVDEDNRILDALKRIQMCIRDSVYRYN